jgi:two-component system, chemotaxis family, chemotaxis protein CheY
MGFTGLSILVIDDNPHMRAIIAAVLRGLGVRDIREASDGAAALERLRDTSVDVIITDYAMEPLDGLDFTRLIRTASDSRHTETPVILMTGHADRVTVAAARDAGVTEILVKPVSAQTIIQRMIAVIDNPRRFVRAPKYTGPDRRRRANAAYQGQDRRDADTWAV